MLGIVVALKREAESFISKLENLKEFKILDKPAYSGFANGEEVVLIISGIGKVSASLSTQVIIDKYSPDCIINFGTAGGMNSSVSILNYYAVEKCCQFDFDLRQLDGVPLGYIQEYNTAYFKANTDKLSFLQTSCLATADRFTDDMVDIDSINEISCSLRDMEGGAIAQVCTSNNIPLYMIKGVTDVYGLRSSQEQFYENLTKVSNGFADIVLTAIDNIKQK